MTDTDDTWTDEREHATIHVEKTDISEQRRRQIDRRRGDQ